MKAFHSRREYCHLPRQLGGGPVPLLKLGSTGHTNRRKIGILPAFPHSDEASCQVIWEQQVHVPLPTFSSPGLLGEGGWETQRPSRDWNGCAILLSEGRRNRPPGAPKNNASRHDCTIRLIPGKNGKRKKKAIKQSHARSLSPSWSPHHSLHP